MSSIIVIERNDNKESATETLDSKPATPTSSYEGTTASFADGTISASPSEVTTTADETDDCSTMKCSKDKMKHKHRNDNAENNQTSSYVGNKNVAEGLMDIALLSANANQLRFLLTYNHSASTYYISMALVVISLIMQVFVGIALIFKRRFRRCRNKRYDEFILGGVFLITVVNILLAALTTTDANKGK